MGMCGMMMSGMNRMMGTRPCDELRKKTEPFHRNRRLFRWSTRQIVDVRAWGMRTHC